MQYDFNFEDDTMKNEIIFLLCVPVQLYSSKLVYVVYSIQNEHRIEVLLISFGVNCENGSIRI